MYIGHTLAYVFRCPHNRYVYVENSALIAYLCHIISYYLYESTKNHVHLNNARKPPAIPPTAARPINPIPPAAAPASTASAMPTGGNN